MNSQDFYKFCKQFCTRIVEKSRVLFAAPLPTFNWWVVSVGGEELKWHQLAHHQLMSQQGPHFSPHSKAKANYKALISGKLVTSGLSVVEFISVHSEKTRLKKLMNMIIIIIMNKSQETTVFYGRQK